MAEEINLKTLWDIGYGLYIVTVHSQGRDNGMISNAVMQITGKPARIGIAINKENLTHQMVQESGVFSISILDTTATLEFIGNFGFHSGRDVNKFAHQSFKRSPLGNPIIVDHTCSVIECQVTNTMDVGSHSLFIVDIVDAEKLNNNIPMTYDYYHRVIKGKTPDKAPFPTEHDTEVSENIQPVPKPVATPISKYQCQVCGHIYDPAEGDPSSNIKPNTSFKDLPDDWHCPICGASKDNFEIYLD
jgi:flavin reductase (DIM6/NTAB) family NADH-FMN oxidoreductase RutF/rubredoxin